MIEIIFLTSAGIDNTNPKLISLFPSTIKPDMGQKSKNAGKKASKVCYKHATHKSVKHNGTSRGSKAVPRADLALFGMAACWGQKNGSIQGMMTVKRIPVPEE